MLAALLALTLSAPAQITWTELHRADGLVVHTRHRAGVNVNEMRAVAVVDADAAVLWALVRDVEGHTALIPDTTVSKIVGTEGGATIVLQRSEPALLDAREYVIAVTERHEVVEGGRVRHTLAWKTAPHHARLLDDRAVHIVVNEGSWAVEPLQDGRSKVTFQVLLDPAGYVPAAIVNFAQGVGAEQALRVLVDAAHRAGRVERRSTRVAATF